MPNGHGDGVVNPADHRRGFPGGDRSHGVGLLAGELIDTVPVHGPAGPRTAERGRGEPGDNDFMTMVDERNRQIMVLFSSGVTNRVEIAELLGYARRSSVSKRLAQIRKAAETFFDSR
jgi:hypothetical protein